MIRRVIPDTYLVDTHAWVEYFRGSQLGIRTADIIDIDITLIPRYTHTLSLTELVRAYHQNGNLPEDLRIIIERSSILWGISRSIALRAGHLRNLLVPITRRNRSSGIGTVDCLLLSIALDKGCKLITGDRDFEVICEPDQFGHFPPDFLFSEGRITVQLADYIYFLGGNA